MTSSPAASSPTGTGSPTSTTTRKPAAASKVHLYAEFLGIDLKKHTYLYDLMEEGLRCPLPEGWKLRTLEPDEDGNACHDFYHKESGKVSNAHPMDEVFYDRARSVIKKHEAAVAARRGNSPAAPSGSNNSNNNSNNGGLPSSMWNDSMSDDDDGENSNLKRKIRTGNLSSVRSYRNKDTAKSGKHFRYLLYCVVIAAVVHFVTYQSVYKIVLEMGKTSASNNNAANNKQEKEMKEGGN